MMRRRIAALAAACGLLTACTPEEVQIYLGMHRDDQRAVVEAVVREAAARWEVDGDLLVRIVACESDMDPLAIGYAYGELGLGQHMPQNWPARAAALGYEPSQWADMRVNADVTAWMLATQGTRPWTASRHCWSR